MNYLRDARGRQITSREMMPLLGFYYGQHIPLDHESIHEFPAAEGGPPIRVHIRKSRSGTARIFYECTCGKLVPFGRIAQHLRARGHL